MVIRLPAARRPSFLLRWMEKRMDGDSSYSGEEIDGVIVGGGIQVRRYLGAEGPGLQGLPDDPQQLGQQRHQGHRADESDCLISFHFFRSMMPRISSSF